MSQPLVLINRLISLLQTCTVPALESPRDGLAVEKRQRCNVVETRNGAPINAG